MALNILEEISFRGYNPNVEVIVPSKDLLEVVNYLESLHLKKKILREETLSTVLQSSEKFLNSYYDLHYIPVILEEEIEHQYVKMNPYHLPVVLSDIDESCVSVVEEFVIKENKKYLYSKYIEMPLHFTKMTALSRTHEITHTQLNHMLGLIQEYYHSELLSIFNEFLHASTMDDEEEVLRAYMMERMIEVIFIVRWLERYSIEKKEDDRENLIEGSCYCESIMEGWYLFYQYYYGDRYTKDLIIYSVQRVFDGKVTLEEMLTELGITFEKSQDAKLLRKYMER